MVEGIGRLQLDRLQVLRDGGVVVAGAAEGEAEAIRLVNEAANTYFVGNAQLLRKLEALEKSLRHNAKIVIPSGSELVNVIGEMAGVLPVMPGNISLILATAMRARSS